MIYAKNKNVNLGENDKTTTIVSSNSTRLTPINSRVNLGQSDKIKRIIYKDCGRSIEHV